MLHKGSWSIDSFHGTLFPRQHFPHASHCATHAVGAYSSPYLPPLCVNGSSHTIFAVHRRQSFYIPLWCCNCDSKEIWYTSYTLETATSSMLILVPLISIDLYPVIIISICAKNWVQEWTEINSCLADNVLLIICSGHFETCWCCGYVFLFTLCCLDLNVVESVHYLWDPMSAGYSVLLYSLPQL